MIYFILGGAKSGKSKYAEQLMVNYPIPWIYLATGRAWDKEMQEKIKLHQKRRGTEWKTIEEPVDIPLVLQQLNGQPVLIDCLTLWLTNLMMEQKDICYETVRLIEGLKAYKGTIVIVSNEVGQGIVPDNAMARQFVSEAGILHQKIALVADDFIVMQAGYPMIVKSKQG